MSQSERAASLAKTARTIAARILGTPQPATEDTSVGVALTLSPIDRIALVLLIVSAMPTDKQQLAQYARSPGYQSLVMALHAILPEKGARSTQQDLLAGIMSGLLDPIQATLAPIAIYELSKLAAEAAALGGPLGQIDASTYNRFALFYDEATPEKMKEAVARMGDLMFELHAAIGMHGRGP